MKKSLLPLLSLLSLSCRQSSTPPPPVVTATPTASFTSQMTDSRFHTADHFLASIEMQISGEPFAQLLGRSLAGYARFRTTPDLYTDPNTGVVTIDPLSYSLAVESYEYSKQPMNNTSFESGAGLSLQYGPVLNPPNPNQATGDAAFILLRDRLSHLADQSGAAVTTWVVGPPPSDNPLNYYGWPGYWPVFAEFQSFDPHIVPDGGLIQSCNFADTYAASHMRSSQVGLYECSSNSLNLPDRERQVTKVLDPTALGFATWKQALWVINYWQSLHDLHGNAIIAVADADLTNVGQPNNVVRGKYADPNDPTGKTLLDGIRGVFLGDIPLEGWQGLTMLDEMDNKSALLCQRLLTSDGVKLSGFATTKEAIAYDYSSPLRWWPAEIAVTETGSAPAPGDSWKYFPQPTSFTIQTATSRLRGLCAVAAGFAEFFALSDFSNPNVGGQLGSIVTFDGDPYPADNQLPDGEETPHDRALATVKIALVNLDRLHFDPAHHVLVDEAIVTAGTVKRGTTVSAFDAGYSIVMLRNALRSISSSLSLYSNDTPDTQGLPTALDGAAWNGAPAPLATRITQLIRAQGDFILAHLMSPDGAVANAYDLTSDKADASPTRLESEAGAIRGLLDAYLATSDIKYRQAATRVYADLERRFWMKDVRAFRTTAGDGGTLRYSPLSFGSLQGALRQYWKLVGSKPGSERVAAELLARIQRLNKLILNGWDDANADNKVQYPAECTGAGLQMAERALTGEMAHPEDKGDREHDCVKEISLVKLPSALAGEVVFKRR